MALNNPLQAFVWGQGGVAMTPEDIAKRRSIEEAIRTRGVDTSPVGHWTQGAARVADALAGAFRRGSLDRAENESKAIGNADFSAAMDSYNTPSVTPTDTLPMTGAADELLATSPVQSLDMSGNDIFSGFMDTVKQGGVQNPYALAAIASTGKAESGFSPENANRSWSDPSQSGEAGTAGGLMSWRGPRLQALYNFAQQNGEKAGAITPATQAKFFLQEDPKLVQALNNAGSVEEAQRLMNNAWAFAGYDQPGGESARRLSAAQSFLPTFQGGGQTAALAIDQQAPAGDGTSLTDEVAAYRKTPEYMESYPYLKEESGGAPQISGQQFNDRLGAAPLPAEQVIGADGLASALVDSNSTGDAPQQAVEQALPVQGMTPERAAAVQQVAQALPVAGQQQAKIGGISQALLKAISSRHISPEQRAVVQALFQQQMAQQEAERDQQTWMQRQQFDQQQQAADPLRQAQLEKAHLDLEDTRNGNWSKLDDGTLFNQRTGETKKTEAASGNTNPAAFRFGGTSVEAQALNGLIESGELTPQQAQQLGAGKTVTGPNGEIIFMTPQGVFGQQAGQQPRRYGGASSDGIDIFGSHLPTPPGDNAGDSGMLPVTGPKVAIDEKKAMTFADRMKTSGSLIAKKGAAGTGIVDALASQIPGVGNFLVSDEYQSLDQAKRDFINAQLRRESGAVISDAEFDNANKQYFPQPGDTSEVIRQKEASRQTVIDGMIRDSGPTYGGSPKKSPVVVDGFTIEEVN